MFSKWSQKIVHKTTLNRYYGLVVAVSTMEYQPLRTVLNIVFKKNLVVDVVAFALLFFGLFDFCVSWFRVDE